MAWVCDRCDGAHPTLRCPQFRKERENHPDALVRQHTTSQGIGTFQTTGRVVRQPGDGSCLFHSLAHGLGPKSNASVLRMQLAYFVAKHPDFTIGGSSLQDWIRWDSGDTVQAYAKRMAWDGAWGGGIELAVCAVVHQRRILVYRPNHGQYGLIAAFGDGGDAAPIAVLYVGNAHYDTLLPTEHPPLRNGTLQPCPLPNFPDPPRSARLASTNPKAERLL